MYFKSRFKVLEEFLVVFGVIFIILFIYSMFSGNDIDNYGIGNVGDFDNIFEKSINDLEILFEVDGGYTNTLGISSMILRKTIDVFNDGGDVLFEEGDINISEISENLNINNKLEIDFIED